MQSILIFPITYFASFAADAVIVFSPEDSQYLLHQWRKSTYYLDTQKSTENKKRKTWFNNTDAFLFFSYFLI